MATITRENIGVLNDKITVKINKEDYLSSFEKSLKNYSKTASIPGFRKGMVPTGMIKKMHGQSVFTDEVLKTVEKELNNYLVNEKLDIFAQPLPLPENDARQIDVNNPNEYAFAFEVGLKPEFSIADIASEKVTQYKVDVTDQMVEEELERLRMRHGKMTDPEAVTSDDNVLTITFIETDAEGNELEGGVRKENSLLVKYFSPEIKEQLSGKKKDESLTVQLSKAFEGKEKEWVLKDLGLTEEAESKHFKLLITKVGLVEKAELNEELYKAAYPAKEIAGEEELKNVIREEIQSHWDTQSANHRQHEIYHILLEHTNITFPADFLKRWMETGTEKPKTQEEVEQEYPDFINQLKWSLINERISNEQQIEVSPDDIKDFAKQQLFGYMGVNSGMDTDQPWVAEYINRMMQDKKFIDDSYYRIRTEKIFKWAEDNAGKEEKTISAEDFNNLLQKHQHHHH